jgi:dolichol-phosphate mannosyltransferase
MQINESNLGQPFPNSAFNNRRQLTVVIPAYNEEKRIGPILEGLVGSQKVDNIIVIFDGNDRTPEVARTFGDIVKVYSYPSKLGRGGAIIEGLKMTNSDVVTVVDADNAAPWYEVVRLSQMVTINSPCVIGSRYTKDAKLLKRESYFKILAGRVWHYLIFFILGLEYKDVQCGLKCFRKEILKEVLPSVTITNRLFDVDLLFNIKKRGYKITEVGIDFVHNSDSRMPYLHVIPLMFLYLFGIRLAHSKVSRYFRKNLNRFSNKLNKMH